jgi:NADPH:quinone reductase-like Zn-dependent oxidoreductase
MKTMQVNTSSNGPALIAAEAPQPQPKEAEVLIRVHAAGVIPTELGWYPTLHEKTGEPRTGAVPGHEFSGEIEVVGPGVQGFEPGQAVYGMNDWFENGATAEFCLTMPGSIAAKPAKLTDAAAASVPISALTAWQGLLERAKIQPGERVLIHGGAGAVGAFAVQLAHFRGAYVITTVAARNFDLVRQLGANQAIDYQSSRFEDEVEKVDVVFDTVGGETLDRSWGVLKPGGRMVTIFSGSEDSTDPRVKDAFFIVVPRHKQLAAVAQMLDAGTLKTFVNAVVPFEKAADAYSGVARDKKAPGKIVVTIYA